MTMTQPVHNSNPDYGEFFPLRAFGCIEISGVFTDPNAANAFDEPTYYRHNLVNLLGMDLETERAQWEAAMEAEFGASQQPIESEEDERPEFPYGEFDNGGHWRGEE